MDMIMDGVQNFVAARSLLELYGGLAAGLLLLSLCCCGCRRWCARRERERHAMEEAAHARGQAVIAANRARHESHGTSARLDGFTQMLSARTVPAEHTRSGHPRGGARPFQSTLRCDQTHSVYGPGRASARGRRSPPSCRVYAGRDGWEYDVEDSYWHLYSLTWALATMEAVTPSSSAL